MMKKRLLLSLVLACNSITHAATSSTAISSTAISSTAISSTTTATTTGATTTTATTTTATTTPPERAIYVVVNKQNTIKTLSRNQVMGLFLGRSRFFPNGQKARPLDYTVDSTLRTRFFETLTGKNIADINTYWATLRYSGRFNPPKAFALETDILQQLQGDLDTIAYLHAASIEELERQNLKVLYQVKQR